MIIFKAQYLGKNSGKKAKVRVISRGTASGKGSHSRTRTHALAQTIKPSSQSPNIFNSIQNGNNNFYEIREITDEMEVKCLLC